MDFEPGKLYVTCSKPPSECSSFKMSYVITCIESESTYRINLDNNKVEWKAFFFNLPKDLDGDRLVVKIYFDDCLMFADHFESTEIPF